MAAKKDEVKPEQQEALDAKAKQDKSEPVSVRTTGSARFARAGRIFTREPKLVSNYTLEQLAEWKAEPMLIVE